MAQASYFMPTEYVSETPNPINDCQHRCNLRKVANASFLFLSFSGIKMAILYSNNNQWKEKYTVNVSLYMIIEKRSTNIEKSESLPLYVATNLLQY